MKEKHLRGKTALITGSGRGIGQAIANHLAFCGANVIIHDVAMDSPKIFNEGDSVEQVADKIGKENSVKTMFVLGDLTKPDIVSSMVENIHSQFGQIDILVPCAGADISSKGETGPNAGKLLDPLLAINISNEDIKAILERNLLTCIYTCKAVVPEMIERKYGWVVVMGSVSATWASPEQAIYGTAKAAVHQYARNLAAMCRPYGVYVNIIAPGMTLSGRFKASRELNKDLLRKTGSLDRYCWPEEVGQTVGFLVSEDASFISGQIIRIDGGKQIWPA
ncbi:SDR family oxidoreductase [Treponema primitia]|uniref:SDR family NAD(P)-dependent oxidoreductase n=1 Tax=Treponema primitia TaxID=88058 RepID=UPI0039800186